MPGTDKYGQGIPYALLDDAPDAQTLAKSIADGAAQHGILRFASAAARGATLVGGSAPVEGMLSYLLDADRIDYYNGSTWITLTPGTWQPITFNSPYVAHSGSPAYRITNGTVELRGLIAVSGGGKFNLQAFHHITTLPPGYRPSAIRYWTCATEWASQTTARAEVQADGRLIILTPGPSGNAPSWISLDSVSFNAT